MNQFDSVRFLEAEVSTWEQVTVGAHRFGGIEFLLGTREIGHVHPHGKVDVALVQSIKEVLVREGKAELHNLYPESGMVSFNVHARGDVFQALWLLKIGYMLQWIRRHAQSRSLRGDVLADIRRNLYLLNLSAALQSCFDDLLREVASE